MVAIAISNDPPLAARVKAAPSDGPAQGAQANESAAPAAAWQARPADGKRREIASPQPASGESKRSDVSRQA